MPADSGFRGALRIRQFDYMLLVETNGSDLEIADAAQGAAKRIAAHFVIEGAALFVDGNGHATAMTAGEMLVRPIGGGARLHAPNIARVVSLDLSAHLLAQHMRGGVPADTLFARRTDDFAARSLFDFAAGLAEGDTDSLSPGVQDVVANLVALVLGSAPAAAPEPEPARPATQAASRLAAIEEYLARHFADSQISPADVAAHFGISVRYLNKLFEPSGRSFRQALVALRMEACREALCDPARDKQTISQIAFNAGLNDLSQFNRQFRAAFGMTPRAMRTAARRGAAPGDPIQDGANAAPGSQLIRIFSHQPGAGEAPDLITTGRAAWGPTIEGRMS